MKKLVTLIALMMIVAMATVACSPSSGPANDPADEGGAKELEPIKLGNIQDLSGTASEPGTANAWGAEYAVRVINEAGGINGRMIEIITLDCKNDVQEGINCYRRLVDEYEVDAIIGPPLSNPALAWVELAEEDKIPIVGHFMDERCTTNEETGEPYNFMFLAEPGCAVQSYCIAEYGLKELGLKTFATMYCEGNAFAVKHAEPFMAYVNAKGGKVVAEETFQWSDVDYRAQATKIASVNPDAVFLSDYAAQAALCYDQLREAGYKGIILGANTLASAWPSLVKTEIYDVYLLQNYDLLNPESECYELMQTFMKEDGREYPVTNAGFGYDAVMVMVDAMKRAKDPTDGVEVAKLLEQCKDVQTSAGPITIDPKTHRPVGMGMYIADYDENTNLRVLTKIYLDEFSIN